MQPATQRPRTARPAYIAPLLALVALGWMPEVWAQASPFMTGANSLQTNILAWLTPIAIILVMVLGVMAMANRISWGWCHRRDPRHRDRLRCAADRGLGPRHVRGLSQGRT